MAMLAIYPTTCHLNASRTVYTMPKGIVLRLSVPLRILEPPLPHLFAERLVSLVSVRKGRIVPSATFSSALISATLANATSRGVSSCIVRGQASYEGSRTWIKNPQRTYLAMQTRRTLVMWTRTMLPSSLTQTPTSPTLKTVRTSSNSELIILGISQARLRSLQD